MLPNPFKKSGQKGSYISDENMNEEEIIKMANYIVKQKMRKGQMISKPSDCQIYLQNILQELPYESFGAIYLDQKNRIITYEILFRGTINHTSIYPRELVKNALLHNTSSVILFHNHPSGDPSPSEEDLNVTQVIQSTLKLINIRLLDHLIIGVEGYESLAELKII
jgi:DNA repair protein RadC